MAATTIWNDLTTWSLWVNASDPTGDQTPIRRIINGDLKTPFSQTAVRGLVGESVLARWRFGQLFGNSSVLEDQTGNGNTAAIPAGVPAETSENGLNCTTRNGYAIVNESSNFDLPDISFINVILSLWFKSNTTNYSDNIGIIAAWHNSSLDIGYGIVINTDGSIVGKFFDGITTSELSPPSVVLVDTKWHHATIVVNLGGGNMFILDNAVPDNFTSGGVSVVTGTKQFTIGSSEFPGETGKGFSGIIDEVYVAGAGTFNSTTQRSHRYETNTFLSPVIDTAKSNSILSSILADFEIPNDSTLTFSFRANNSTFLQNDRDIVWTNFTAPNQILSNTEANVSDLGVFVQGQFHQIRVKMSPSNSKSSSSDPLQTESPVLKSLQVNTSPDITLLHPSTPAYNPGTVLQQIVEFQGASNIHKVSLNLSVTSKDVRTFVVGKSGVISFQSANFKSSRHNWVFQPVVQNEWESSGTAITNTYQTEEYGSSQDAVVNAPYLHYDLFFPEGGSYDLWGYGCTIGKGIFWGFDNDTTHLKRLTLGLGTSGWIGIPRWTKFGSIFLEEGGTHGFTVYLGDLDSIMLDQWYFTTNTDLANILDEEGSTGLELPLPLSKSPFNTAVRLRSLDNGSIYDLHNPPSGVTSVTGWGPSADKSASGKFNYAIQDHVDNEGVDFVDGLLIEYWQIGGDRDYFASWDHRLD